MYAIIISSEEVFGTLVDQQPKFVVLNENKSLVTQEVIKYQVALWKKSFHHSELPITPSKYPDAVDAFLRWLEELNLGYVVPHMAEDSSVSLNIFDLV